MTYVKQRTPIRAPKVPVACCDACGEIVRSRLVVVTVPSTAPTSTTTRSARTPSVVGLACPLCWLRYFRPSATATPEAIARAQFAIGIWRQAFGAPSSAQLAAADVLEATA